MQTSPHHSLAYRPDIDALRALAVTTVVGFHAFSSFMSSGYLGVDVFFVISGFLITKILIKKFEDQQNLKQLLGFWAARIRRLFPALLMVLTIALLGGYLFLFPEELESLGLHSWRSLIYWQNFTLISEIGYFDPESIKKPLLHLWSLSVEEHFYILWPFFVIIVSIFPKFKTLGLKVILLSTFTLSLLYSAYLGTTNADVSFYHSLARFWEISLGGLIALYPLQKAKSQLGLLFLVLLTLSLFIPSNVVPVLLHQFLPCGLTALIILFGFSIVKTSPILWVGKISYPLYLWHWCLFSFANIIFQIELGSPLSTSILILLSLILAGLTYLSIEKIRYIKHGLTICVIWALGLFVIAVYFHKTSGGPERPHLAYIQDYGLQQVRHDKRDEACMKFARDPKFAYCRFDDQGFDKTVAIIGDSHGHVLFPGMVKIARKRGYNTVLLANSACPTLPGFEWSNKKISVENCQGSISQIFKLINTNKNIEKIIITTRGPSYIHGETPRPFTADNVQATLENFRDKERYNYESFGKGLVAAAQKLSHMGKGSIFYMLENPELDFSPADSLPRPFVRSQSKFVSRKLYDIRMEKYNETVTNAAKNRMTVLNPRNAMCDDTKCHFFKKRLLYSDDDHFSEYGGYYILSHFEDRIFEASK